jgi:hypothetical protein
MQAMIQARTYLLAILIAMPACAECIPVEADHILGKDLAAARKEFAALDPGADIGFSPRPGVTRVIPAWELVALARRSGITTDGLVQSVCFVRPEKVIQVIQPAPKPAVVELEVLRGAQVMVEVTSGAALVRFEADAESSGRTGESVLVRNPENGKLFQARVEGKGKVMVQR